MTVLWALLFAAVGIAISWEARSYVQERTELRDLDGTQRDPEIPDWACTNRAMPDGANVPVSDGEAPF